MQSLTTLAQLLSKQKMSRCLRLTFCMTRGWLHTFLGHKYSQGAARAFIVQSQPCINAEHLNSYVDHMRRMQSRQGSSPLAGRHGQDSATHRCPLKYKRTGNHDYDCKDLRGADAAQPKPDQHTWENCLGTIRMPLACRATCAVEETQACVHWQANAHYRDGSYKPQKLQIMALQDSDMASDWPFRVLVHLGFIILYKDLALRNFQKILSSHLYRFERVTLMVIEAARTQC